MYQYLQWYIMNRRWLAGFFDGEGCVSYITQKNGTKHWRIQICQSGDEGLKILTEIQQFLGYGSIYHQKRFAPSKRERYNLTVTKRAYIEDFKARVGVFCKLKTFDFYE